MKKGWHNVVRVEDGLKQCGIKSQINCKTIFNHSASRANYLYGKQTKSCVRKKEEN